MALTLTDEQREQLAGLKEWASERSKEKPIYAANGQDLNEARQSYTGLQAFFQEQVDNSSLRLFYDIDGQQGKTLDASLLLEIPRIGKNTSWFFVADLEHKGLLYKCFAGNNQNELFSATRVSDKWEEDIAEVPISPQPHPYLHSKIQRASEEDLPRRGDDFSGRDQYGIAGPAIITRSQTLKIFREMDPLFERIRDYMTNN